MRIGTRVQLHPGMDRWMRGDKFGTVTRLPSREHGTVGILMDRSGQTIRVFADKLEEVCTPEEAAKGQSDYHRCGPDSCNHGQPDKDDSTPDW